jgi:UDP-glucose 4-epimerase
VYASSSSVYGDDVSLPMHETVRPQPVSPYGVTKLSAEQLCYLYYVNFGVPAVSLRYFTVYGPRQRPDMGFHTFFVGAMRNEPVPVFGDGRQTRDFTFVSDAVAAAASASTRGTPGAVYNIGGGSRVELLDVFELIGRITGRPLRLKMLEPQAGDMRDTYADTARARAELAFGPAVTLEQGLRAQFQWMTEAGLFNT